MANTAKKINRRDKPSRGALKSPVYADKFNELVDVINELETSDQNLTVESVKVAVGTAGTNVTATTYGDGKDFTTILSLADVTFADIPGGANLGLGKLIYTLPAGPIVISSAYMSVALTEDDGNVTADTPDLGVGTTVATGAVAVLGGTAAFENIITGQTAADCSGTATVALITTVKSIATADAHTVYLNVADGWAASGEDDLKANGTVTLKWSLLA
jgi:hypothetical protein